MSDSMKDQRSSTDRARCDLRVASLGRVFKGKSSLTGQLRTQGTITTVCQSSGAVAPVSKIWLLEYFSIVWEKRGADNSNGFRKAHVASSRSPLPF